MGDPYIERKTTPSKLDATPSVQRNTTPSKLDATPSVQRNTTPSKLDATPSVQRESTGSRGTPLKTGSAPTQRQTTQQEAQKMGIDTKGLSTREVKEAVSERREAQKELADFMKGVMKDLPQNTPIEPSDAPPARVVAGKMADKPSFPTPSRHKDSPKTELGTDFYCYFNGQYGIIPLLNRGFSAL